MSVAAPVACVCESYFQPTGSINVVSGSARIVATLGHVGLVTEPGILAGHWLNRPRARSRTIVQVVTGSARGQGFGGWARRKSRGARLLISCGGLESTAVEPTHVRLVAELQHRAASTISAPEPRGTITLRDY